MCMFMRAQGFNMSKASCERKAKMRVETSRCPTLLHNGIGKGPFATS